MSNNPQRDEILLHIDPLAEFQKYGGRVPPGAITAPNGFHPVHSIDREDKKASAAIYVGSDPSKRGIYVDQGPGGAALSFFDMMCQLPNSPWMMGKEVYRHYAKELGLEGGKSPKKQSQSKPKGKIVTTYDYTDAAGNLVFQVCRLEPKSFRQRRPDGAGGWIYNLQGVEPVLYHRSELQPAALIYLVEGEKDCDRLRGMGVTATCNSMGAGKWRKSYNQALQGKGVVILGDNDLAGKAHAQNVARELHGVAAIVKVIELPGLPPKGDVSDWLDAGGTLEQLRALVSAAPDWDPATAPAPPKEPQKATGILGECGHAYSVSKGYHCLGVIVGEEVKEKPLCNFVARVSDEITRDDGARVTKEFVISGNVADLPLPPVKVLTKDYDRMAWVRDQWGAAASVSPTRNDTAHLPNAILVHSRALGINRQTLYAHTGFREIGGIWRYLHAGGAVGAGAPVAVDLGNNLRRYSLPEPGGVEAAQASLRFLDVAPWEVTAPLFACAYLAPFADLLKVDFSVWLYGPTGAMKSTLAALALAHYGDFTRLTLPGSWLSTVNALEKLCFVLKDCLVVVDDFTPASSAKDANKMSENAGRLIYQAGNRSGRGRLTSDLSARPDHYPRCLIIATAEMLLPGRRQSATARYLAVQMDSKKNPIDLARLTAAQAEAPLYAGAMAAYLEDLAPRLDEVQEEIRELWQAYRGAFQGTAHQRIPEIQAWLAVGFEYAMRFFVRLGAVSQDEADQMLNRAWKVFETLGEKHSRIIQGERPALKFLAILGELFTQGKIYVESATTAGAPPAKKDDLGWRGSDPARNAEQVGWADDQRLYLIPEMVYRVICEVVTRQGDFLGLGKNEMLLALAQDGFIEPGRDGNTKIKSIRGASKRVIVLPQANLFRDEDEDIEK